jgi:formylglycine-generating enzyme required for sulfatase activity
MKKNLLLVFITIAFTNVSAAGFESKKIKKNYTQRLKMKFVKISPTPFIMGSPVTEKFREKDEAQRAVTLTKDFEVMTTEVTQSMYVKVMGKNPSSFQRYSDCPLTFAAKFSKKTKQVVTLCPHHPVEEVNYEDAQIFIALINAKTGLKYRLPTEAEWEYAARAGSVTPYFFGKSRKKLKKYAIYTHNAGRKTHQVGSIRTFANKPNPFGLYDMYGNVGEWVQDRYTTSPVGGVNPKGPSRGNYRVIRGGSWRWTDYMQRSASRGYDRPDTRNHSVGFRLVRILK